MGYSTVQDLAKSISAHSPLSLQSSVPVATTALTLLDIQQPEQSSFLPSRLLLLPASSAPPSDDIAMRLYQLALSAEAAATSLACSSILLGQTNESDDFGDVAVWLGEGDFRHSNAPNILQKLSLDSGLQINQIRTMPLSFRGTLPSTLSSGTSSPQLDSLVDQLMILTDKHSFRIPLATDPSRVVVFLLGKFGNEWGGLVGLGNWFD